MNWTLYTEEERRAIQNFRWRDKENYYHLVKDMGTQHLYYSLCLVWNHVMPEAARTPNYKSTIFPPDYTKDYFQLAIRAFVIQLAKRENLDIPSRDQFTKMVSWLRTMKVAKELGAKCTS